jgi:hypothetical protein
MFEKNLADSWHWLEYKYGGLFVVMRRCGDVVAIQLRGPK